MREWETTDSGPPQASGLRHEAERRLRDKEPVPDHSTAEVDARALIHELRVHQIELEMQNVELQRAQAAAQAASEKYYDLFDFAPIGYFLWDAQGRIVEVNLAGATLLGLNRTAVVQKRFAQFVTMEDRPAFADFRKRVLTTDTKQTCEVKLLSNGQPVHVLVEGIAVQDSQGQGKLCRVAVMDITQQNQGEEQLKATNETLERRVKERTVEAQRRANQLQQLAAQMTQTEERERRRLSQVLHDGLQQVLVAARLRLGAAARRIQDERAIAAIEEANNLIDEAITESRSLTKELSPPVLYDGGLAAGLEWLGHETETKYQLPVTVQVVQETEPDDLTTKVFVFHAARELILNAVKHANASSLKVCLSKVDENLLEVLVQDDGTGFDVEMMVRKGDRTGFGLFSIRERLNVIGGQLTITSSPLAGTKATILAPCHRSQEPKRRTGAIKKHPVAPPDAYLSSTNRVRVLLADDHPVLRKGLAEALREYPSLDLIGEAGDGQEAVDMAQQMRPDVVLMDITMPRMDGIEATRQIKETVPETCVIALSMHETDEMIAAMKNAGASDYVTKTVPAEDMISVILRACPRM